MKKTLLTVGLLACFSLAHADDFSETLKTAKEAYDEGDLAGAQEELNYARQLLGQMRAKALQGFLPEALPGWERNVAKDSRSGGGGLAIMGGGVTASAKYKATEGRDRLTISLIADSPMLQGMGMLFSNAAMAGSGQGEMKRIKRQKVLVKANGDLTTLIDKRLMVEIKGRAPAEVKEEFFKTIDFKKLKTY